MHECTITASVQLHHHAPMLLYYPYNSMLSMLHYNRCFNYFSSNLIRPYSILSVKEQNGICSSNFFPSRDNLRELNYVTVL